MADVIVQLSDLEKVALSIAATGEDMLAIGSWDAPLKTLTEKGLMKKISSWPSAGAYRITESGQAAFDAMETEEVREMVAEHNERVRRSSEPAIEEDAAREGEHDGR